MSLIGINYEKELNKLISDKKLIKELMDYMNKPSISLPEKYSIIRAVKRTRIGDKITKEAIIEHSRNLPSLIKQIKWVEPPIKEVGEEIK